MAPDTTRLGSDLIIASLQRELAEARAEIESLKSRPSLTPLTDESVRGVLIQCAPDEETTGLYGEFGLRGSFKLRPASEFGVPESSDLQAERDQLDVMCHEGAARCERYKSEAERLRRELRQCQDGIDYVPMAKAYEALHADRERLRKAIEEVVNLPPLPLQCRKTLQAALTPPTAASGGASESLVKIIGRPDKPIHRPECQCESCLAWIRENPLPPSAPAAESEVGDGWQSHEIHFDAREMAALESLAEGYGHTTWPDAIVRCKAERDSLSARLAACEERCKELEAGLRFIRSDPGLNIASRFFYDQLLVPKAEGWNP